MVQGKGEEGEGVRGGVTRTVETYRESRIKEKQNAGWRDGAKGEQRDEHMRGK